MNTLRLRHGRPRYFSLVELLVVIGILAILSSLLLGALSRARGAAMAANCSSQLRQLLLGAHGYLNDFEHYPPTWGKRDGVTLRWADFLSPYLAANRQVLVCPNDPAPAPYPGSSVVVSYGINNFNLADSAAHCFWYPVAAAAVRSPSQVIFLADALSGQYLVGGGKEWQPEFAVQVKAVAYRHNRARFTAGFADGHVLLRDRTERREWNAAE